MKFVIRLKNFVKELIHYRTSPANNIDYWKKRATLFGERSVYNIQHSADELQNVTLLQKQIIYRALKKALSGNEKMVLDFGCGTGRFTADLAGLISGSAIGADPISSLLNKAPAADNVSYIKIKHGKKIPIADRSIDILFICLVLGGIKNNDLDFLLGEFKRLLKNNGLICLIENTSKQSEGQYWYFRDEDQYKKLFNFSDLQKVDSYQDVGETISVFTGRVNP